MSILTQNQRKLNLPLLKKTPSLPFLFAFSDEARGQDPMELINRLPEGSGFIFRHYLYPSREHLALKVVNACRDRNLLCFIAGDLQLCIDTKADGIHLPERLLRRPIIIETLNAEIVYASFTVKERRHRQENVLFFNVIEIHTQEPRQVGRQSSEM